MSDPSSTATSHPRPTVSIRPVRRSHDATVSPSTPSPFPHSQLPIPHSPTPSDLDILFAMQLNPEANRMAVANPRDRATFDAFWARVLSNQTPPNVARVIVTHDERGRETVVGQISCFKLDGQDAVGYWIAREHWGRGIATEALRLLLREVPVRPLHARAASTNTASIRVLERCGFKLIGHQHTPATPDGRFPACEEALLRLD